MTSGSNVQPAQAGSGNQPTSTMLCSGWFWFMLFLFTAVIVQSPYFFYSWDEDEARGFGAMRLIAAGEVPIWEWWLDPHNEHSIVLWKMLFSLQWYLFGESRPGWQLLIIICSTLSSWVLFDMLRRASRPIQLDQQAMRDQHQHPSAPACQSLTNGELNLSCTGFELLPAGLAGVVFAGVSIASFDSPVGWYAVSHLNLGIVFWLLALRASQQLERSSRPARRVLEALGWMVLMMLSMHALIVLAPSILLAFIWHGPMRRTISRGTLVSAIVGWLALILLAVVLIRNRGEVYNPFAAEQKPQVLAAIKYFPLTLLRTFADLLVPASLLFPPKTMYDQREVGLGLVISFFVLCVFVARCRVLIHADKQQQLRSWVPLLVGCLCYQAICVYFRSSWPIVTLLGWGRYRYVPMLALAYLVGVLFTNAHRPATATDPTVVHGGKKRQRQLIIGLALLWLTYIGVQWFGASTVTKNMQQLVAERQKQR